jgi:Cu+-exporting ATPase
VREIREALEDGGFDVCDVSPDDVAGKSQIGDGEIGYLDRFLDKWSSDNHESKPSHPNKHLENCELCRREEIGKDGSADIFLASSSSATMPQKHNTAMDDDKDLSLVVVESADSQDIWQASLAVGGMTCAACVVNITETLEKKRWIKNVVVNLSKYFSVLLNLMSHETLDIQIS